MRIAFNVPFIQASWCLTGVDSYPILEIKNVREMLLMLLGKFLLFTNYGVIFLTDRIIIGLKSVMDDQEVDEKRFK